MSWLIPYKWFYGEKIVSSEKVNNYLIDVIKTDKNCFLDNKILDPSCADFDINTVNLLFMFINKYTLRNKVVLNHKVISKNKEVLKCCMNIVQFPPIIDLWLDKIYGKYGSYCGMTFEGLISFNYTKPEMNLQKDDFNVILKQIEIKYTFTNLECEKDYYKLFIAIEIASDDIMKHKDDNKVKDLFKLRTYFILQNMINYLSKSYFYYGNEDLVSNVMIYFINWNEKRYYFPQNKVILEREKFKFPLYLNNCKSFARLKNFILNAGDEFKSNLAQIEEIEKLFSFIIKNNMCYAYFKDINKNCSGN